mmetsp:Transcript_35231/g.85392  ORF Transcript_35231/g.85392 Transcript_35231/m.85392 type:complete len:313 (-) Transcript_35231:1037-1975(-)
MIGKESFDMRILKSIKVWCLTIIIIHFHNFLRAGSLPSQLQFLWRQILLVVRTTIRVMSLCFFSLWIGFYLSYGFPHSIQTTLHSFFSFFSYIIRRECLEPIKRRSQSISVFIVCIGCHHRGHQLIVQTVWIHIQQCPRFQLGRQIFMALSCRTLTGCPRPNFVDNRIHGTKVFHDGGANLGSSRFGGIMQSRTTQIVNRIQGYSSSRRFVGPRKKCKGCINPVHCQICQLLLVQSPPPWLTLCLVIIVHGRRLLRIASHQHFAHGLEFPDSLFGLFSFFLVFCLLTHQIQNVSGNVRCSNSSFSDNFLIIW